MVLYFFGSSQIVPALFFLEKCQTVPSFSTYNNHFDNNNNNLNNSIKININNKNFNIKIKMKIIFIIN